MNEKLHIKKPSKYTRIKVFKAAEDSLDYFSTTSQSCGEISNGFIEKYREK